MDADSGAVVMERAKLALHRTLENSTREAYLHGFLVFVGFLASAIAVPFPNHLIVSSAYTPLAPAKLLSLKIICSNITWTDYNN